VNLIDENSAIVKHLLHISLGVLGGLLLLGTVWEISARKKDKTKQDQVAPLRLGEHRMLKYVKVEMC